MKRVLLSFLLAFFAADFLCAEPVTAEMARQVARNWIAANGGTFGGEGSVREIFGEYDAEETLLWWNVALDNSTAIIVSPETRIEPIICVVGAFDESLPAAHPLRALLEGDLKNRLAALTPRQNAPRILAADPSQAAEKSAAEKKWSKYLAPRMLFASPIQTGNPAIVYKIVDGFEQGGKFTHWNQSNMPFKDYSMHAYTTSKVYNKYTPNNFVCGCVATAGAALLQYFGVSQLQGEVTNNCKVGTETESFTTMGGTYDWSILPKDLGGNAEISTSILKVLTDNQIDLLSRVTYDIGVCVKMQWSATSSGAYLPRLINALRDNFGLTDARYVNQPPVSSFEELIYAQNRCGAPVLLGIAQNGTSIGHQVIAVGYGEDETKTPYTRIFMGWSGSGDAWYNLPNVQTSVGYSFDVIDGIGTMLGTTAETTPVNGFVNDESGNPIANATVTFGAKTLTTDANGFFGTRVCAEDFLLTLGPSYFMTKPTPARCAISQWNTREMNFTVGTAARVGTRGVMLYQFPDGIERVYDADASTLASAIPQTLRFTMKQKTDEGIAYSFLEQFPALMNAAGGNYAQAAATTASNGINTYGECFVAGLDPTSAESRFAVTIEDAAGKIAVKWTPNLNTASAPQTRIYSVEEKVGDSKWKEVVGENVVGGIKLNAAAQTSEARFYRVKVNLPE